MMPNQYGWCYVSPVDLCVAIVICELGWKSMGYQVLQHSSLLCSSVSWLSQNNKLIHGIWNHWFVHVSLLSLQRILIWNDWLINGRLNDQFIHDSLISLQRKLHPQISTLIVLSVAELWWLSNKLWLSLYLLFGFGYWGVVYMRYQVWCSRNVQLTRISCRYLLLLWKTWTPNQYMKIQYT